jgi:ABC-type lipoprotein export system ATPase subunit
MGPSGSGKTTLINVISGIDKADKGDILLQGTNISNMKKSELALFRRRNLGLVFQDFNLLDSLSVRENILLPMILEEKTDEEQEEQLKKITEFLGISEILSRDIWNISGEQKQRAAISRALINNPALICADEPTGNLDSKSTKDVMSYFKKVNEDFHTSILMVTHDIFAASYCKRVILLKDGKVVHELRRTGSRNQLYNQIMEMMTMIGGDMNDFSTDICQNAEK